MVIVRLLVILLLLLKCITTSTIIIVITTITITISINTNTMIATAIIIANTITIFTSIATTMNTITTTRGMECTYVSSNERNLAKGISRNTIRKKGVWMRDWGNAERMPIYFHPFIWLRAAPRGNPVA